MIMFQLDEKGWDLEAPCIFQASVYMKLEKNFNWPHRKNQEWAMELCLLLFRKPVKKSVENSTLGGGGVP